MKFSREFAMPNSETFSLPPVARLMDRYLPRSPDFDEAVN